MRIRGVYTTTTAAIAAVVISAALTQLPIPQGREIQPPSPSPEPNHNPNIDTPLFADLEELSRVVDIAYCVSVGGIRRPFVCAGRCGEFEGWELVGTFEGGGGGGGVGGGGGGTGYVVLDHGGGRGRGKGRVLVVFRGTYSFRDTIVDLSTVPQGYVAYPEGGEGEGGEDEDEDEDRGRGRGNSGSNQKVKKGWWKQDRKTINEEVELPNKNKKHEETATKKPKCTNCTVHSGFFSDWKSTRPTILSHLNHLSTTHPNYALHIIGHSLGGALACLAALELHALGHNPTVTTFGEPRVGNAALASWIDAVFPDAGPERRYRRVTHARDPVPLLPLPEWGYASHAGEIYIARLDLPPEVGDVRLCFGERDVECSAGGEGGWVGGVGGLVDGERGDGERGERGEGERGEDGEVQRRWGLPTRYRIWQLFFAHRDYFWRLGVCVPGGDPLDWGRERYPSRESGEGEL